MTANTPFNSTYFLVVLISDISFSVCFILLNSQRTTVEAENLTSDLLQSVADRQRVEEDLHQKRLQMIAMEERERMGRDLHDGLGQVISFLNLQAQTAESFIDEDKLSNAREVIQHMAKAAKDAGADVRRYIFGLRAVVS